MGRWAAFLDSVRPQSGRTVSADGTVINVGDVAADVQGFVLGRPTPLQTVDAGGLFIAGDRQTVAAGSSMSLHLENPAGSGADAIIRLFSAYTDNASALRITFYRDATSSGAAITPFNFNMGSAATTPLTIKSALDALTGGTEISARARVTERASFKFADAPIVVPPGSSVALSVTVPTGLSSSEVDINVSWIMRAIA